MPKVLTSTEAQSKFGSVMKWTAEHDDEVIIELYNKPTAVLMSYEEYQKVRALRAQEERRQAWAAVQALRKRVRARNPDLSDAEAYRLAGFGEEVIREILAADVAPASDSDAG